MDQLYTRDSSGNFAAVVPEARTVLSTIAEVHNALVQVGSVVPKSVAIPILAVTAPAAWEVGLNALAMASSGNYIGAVATGGPLVASLVVGLYSSFTKTKTGFTDAQIHTAVLNMPVADRISLLTGSNLSHDQLQATVAGLQSSPGAGPNPAATS
jgi:hypothetical protein